MPSKDKLSSIVVFLFSLVALLLGRTYGGGAGMFPMGLAVIMMVISALIFLRAVFLPASVPAGVDPTPRDERITLTYCIVATLIYFAAIIPLGFLIASILFIPVMAYSLGYRNHIAIIGTAVCFVSVLYYIFIRVFYTPMPKGSILPLLGF